MDKGNPATDPKGLIFEAYRIEGITEAECRSIFLDWALSLPDAAESTKVLAELIEEHATRNPDHPMTAVMRAGMTRTGAPKRRGGWRARQRD